MNKSPSYDTVGGRSGYRNHQLIKTHLRVFEPGSWQTQTGDYPPAGPGTGKTTCIAQRVADLVLKDKIPPKQILSVTFTRDWEDCWTAAQEMRHKLEKQGVPSHQLPDVRTLHSKAVSLLRRYHSHLGLGSLVRPLGGPETRLVLQDVVADLAAAGTRLRFTGEGRVHDYLRSYQSEQSGKGVSPTVNVQKHLMFTDSYERLQQFYRPKINRNFGLVSRYE